MRIAINNVCNSSCPYCFAGTMGLDKTNNISLQDYVKVLNWMEKTGDKEIYIYGGEPTIHPDFRKILSVTKSYGMTNGWKHIGIYTNAVKLYEYTDLLSHNMRFLININSPKVLGEEKYRELIKSLNILDRKNLFFEKGVRRAVLGCNLYHEENDYNFFWNIVDRFKCEAIRVSVSSPKNSKYIFDRKKYFNEMKNTFLEFIREANKRNLYKFLDCSQIPPCFFTHEEIDEIYLNAMPGYYLAKCSNSQHICLPTLEISCCYGDKNFGKNKRNLFDFKDIQEIEEWSNSLRTNEQIEKHFFDECDSCNLKNTECTAGCFGFYDDRSLYGK